MWVVVLCCWISAVRARGTLPVGEVLVVRFGRVVGLIVVCVFVVVVAVVTEQTNVHRGQEGEDERLDQPDEELHEVENKEEAGAVKEVFAAKDVTKETDG
jgi:hypothetical protein